MALVFGCNQKAEEPEQTSKVVSQKISTTSGTPKQQTPKATSGSTKQQEMKTEALSGLVAQQKPMQYLAVGYDPKGKIDPFAPLIKDEPVKPKIEAKTETELKAGQKEKRVPKTPLEKIELSQLRLRAIIIAPSGNKALVEESTGKGYIITKGTYIGRNQGMVTSIQKDKVIVEEMLENIQGNMIAKEKELRLPKPPGEE
jgi:type IV pilus assembly protein PilP